MDAHAQAMVGAHFLAERAEGCAPLWCAPRCGRTGVGCRGRRALQFYDEGLNFMMKYSQDRQALEPGPLARHRRHPLAGPGRRRLPRRAQDLSAVRRRSAAGRGEEIRPEVSLARRGVRARQGAQAQPQAHALARSERERREGRLHSRALTPTDRGWQNALRFGTCVAQSSYPLSVSERRHLCGTSSSSAWPITRIQTRRCRSATFKRTSPPCARGCAPAGSARQRAL